MLDADTFNIIEGSPNTVAAQVNELIAVGWKLSGDLFLTKFGDQVIAFQGVKREPPLPS